MKGVFFTFSQGESVGTVFGFSSSWMCVCVCVCVWKRTSFRTIYETNYSNELFRLEMTERERSKATGPVRDIHFIVRELGWSGESQTATQMFFIEFSCSKEIFATTKLLSPLFSVQSVQIFNMGQGTKIRSNLNQKNNP